MRKDVDVRLVLHVGSGYKHIIGTIASTVDVIGHAQCSTFEVAREKKEKNTHGYHNTSETDTDSMYKAYFRVQDFYSYCYTKRE